MRKDTKVGAIRAAAVSAAREVLDRAVGRAEQSISQDTTLRSVSAADYKPDFTELLARVKADEDRVTTEAASNGAEDRDNLL